MLIARFEPTTQWVGKTITREGGVFYLEDYGPISAADVLSYDREGQISWADEGQREPMRELADASADAVSMATHRWAAGERDATLVTRNGGETWTRNDVGPLTLMGVAFSDANHGWAVALLAESSQPQTAALPGAGRGRSPGAG